MCILMTMILFIFMNMSIRVSLKEDEIRRHSTLKIYHSTNQCILCQVCMKIKTILCQ